MQESGEDQERRHSVIPILLAFGFGEITNLEGGGGGKELPNKGRYGCTASAKPRLETISPKNLMPGQKVPKNLMTGQVFMTSGVPNMKILSK